MPSIATIGNIASIATGKRGRKATPWNRGEYMIPAGSALNITSDVASACKCDEASVLLHASGVKEMTNDQSKLYRAALSLARVRAAEANDQPTTDSGGYSVSGIGIGIVTDADGSEFLGLYVKDATEATDDEDEEDDSDEDDSDQDDQDEQDA
jgi:hypothetical protein